MAINEKKMQIVIDNYFKSECNVDTSIRDAFEKGFRIGVKKTVYRPKGEWIQDPSYIGVSDVPICSNCRKRPPRIECGGKLIGGYGAEATGSVWQSEFKYHRSDFCPNCGARMKGEEE